MTGLLAGLTVIALAAGQESTCALFQWEPAEGPVSDYLVLVEGRTTLRRSFGALGLICGSRGDRFRLSVVPFDALGRQGPASEWSDWHQIVGTGDELCP